MCQGEQEKRHNVWHQSPPGKQKGDGASNGNSGSEKDSVLSTS